MIGLVLTGTLALVISVLTLSSVPAVEVSGSDKLHHALAFAALAFPMAAIRPTAAVWVLLGAGAYGGIIELIQPHVGRHAEWGDLAADAAGAACGIITGIAANWLHSRFQ